MVPSLFVNDMFDSIINSYSFVYLSAKEGIDLLAPFNFKVTCVDEINDQRCISS